MHDPARLVEQLIETWASIDALCGEIEDAEWATPSGCPGWSVLDCLSHVVGVESELAGDPVPDAPVSVGDPPWVRDEFGRHMELAVWARRGRPAADVVGEFRVVVPRRIPALRAVAAMAPDAEVSAVMGLAMSVGRFLQIRLFDCFLHEQDMRRATGRPGHLAGPAADQCVSFMARGVQRVVPERAELDGEAVEIQLTGGPVPSVVLGTPSGAAPAVATLSMGLATFLALGSGRVDADRASVEIDGRRPVAEIVMDRMSITP